SAVVAATTTNLAAILPFLFVGGLVGLLFRELIFTISAAILASLIVALTLVPALGSAIPIGKPGLLRKLVDRVMAGLRDAYGWLVSILLRAPWLAPILFILGLVFSLPVLQTGKQVLLPKMDEGRIRVSITADPGINLDEMDNTVRTIEKLILEQPEVESAYTTVGGYVFGRSQFESSNRSSIWVQLVSITKRHITSDAWIQRVKAALDRQQFVGVKVRMRSRGIRGIRLGHGDDDISVRV
ncbi:MAG: efflux RND transporter permease subunit, partial [Gammaproteobacteria bacterium]|nr:efflux RND transporter permease subunit [Gammaproteobacteria bacterium]